MYLGSSSAALAWGYLGWEAQSYKHDFSAAHPELGVGETDLRGRFSSGDVAEAFKVFSSFAWKHSQAGLGKAM